MLIKTRFCFLYSPFSATLKWLNSATLKYFMYNIYYMNDFDYLGEGEVYLDSACQSLRPRSVINAINKYYTEHNSCGERVKYKWGIETDEKVDATREKVLKFLKLSPRKYTTSFTLNTTYGINLILNQLDN